ncbi:MAG: ankyrin repeat domain-containing protein [Parachlamydia sp.]|nr:ankyrin repeat domain-containing protein [Parachlamydia sp.]
MQPVGAMQHIDSAQQLFYDVHTEDVKAIEAGLKKDGIDMKVDEQGLSLLHQAARSSVVAVKILLTHYKKKGKEVLKERLTYTDPSRGGTVLHWAAASYSPFVGTIIQILVQAKAKVDAKDKEGGTPLHWAAEKGNQEGISALLANGADILAKDATSGRYEPLFWAIRGRCPDVLLYSTEHIKNQRDILAKGEKDKDIGYKWRFTPLHMAAKLGNCPLTALLCCSKCISDKETPAYLAVISNKASAAKVILECYPN